ncbi:hypothetical protein Afil01_31220 [Actinorhabdospora filicis]|uniref:LamG-like jellyroll fold domain-containing protein n=1 Tax=Actinorhabdospora filicis TaxID=1785913 RepID=A0A9W6SLX2_9ACTN|nr:hypothetical protein Afil01_31220 [Actinorhabdospora filicis]
MSVEALAVRTPYTQVIAAPDGTVTMASSLVPRWVPGENGSWRDVDPSLVAGADGRLRPRASLARVSFSPGGDQRLAELVSAEGKTFSLSWPTVLPAGTVSADAVLYPNVFPDVDLKVRATVTGFTHTLVVKSQEAAANPALVRIRYVLGGDAVVSETPQGGLRVTADGRLLASASPASMWDSATTTTETAQRGYLAEPSTAEASGDGAQIAPVDVEVSDEHLTLVPDPGLLTGADTVFPLYIDPDFSTEERNWAYANSSDTTWGTSPAEYAARVGVDPSSGWTYRSMFRFPTDANGVNLDGKQILQAHFTITLYHSYDCAPTSVNIWRSRTPASPRTSWANAKLDKWLAWKDAAANKGVCYDPADPKLDFKSETFTNDVQVAANEKWDYYTVALSAKDLNGSNETSQGRWKKFDQSTALLKVVYNSYPEAPSAMRVGATSCGTSELVMSGGNQILASVFGDDDTTQQTLTGTVEYGPVGGTVSNAATTTATGGKVASYPLTGLAEGHYQWRMRSDDGYAKSPWSPWCYFQIDSTVPAAPTITSTDYPKCVPGSDCPQTTLPGLAGAFTFSTTDDAVKYLYGWAGEPDTPLVVTVGASKTISLSPPGYGRNILYVRTVDTAGNQSADATYEFEVGRAAPPVAGWDMEQYPPSGTPAAALGNTVSGGQALTTTGSFSWDADTRLVGAKTAGFSGGAAQTALPVVDTSTSFSMSAWVRLTSKATSGSIIGQDGAYNNGIYFGYVDDFGTWALRFTTKDDPTYTWTASAIATSTPVLGVWTHVAATYDAGAKKASMFINGVREGTIDVDGHWNATGKLRVGSGFHRGAVTDYWQGQIARVRIFNRVIGQDDIVEGAQDLKPLMGSNAVARWNFDTDFGSTAVNQVPGWGHNLSISAPASLVDYNSSFALGTEPSGYAQSSGGGTLRTDQSFTVTAWAQLNSVQDTATVVSQDGTVTSAFRLQNRKITVNGIESSQWCFSLNLADTATSAATTACAPEASTTDITHLIGVYDAFRNEIRLYVNGARLDSTGAATPVASSSVPSRLWNSTGPTAVGRGKSGTSTVTDTFSGYVDDVAVFQGAMTSAQADDFYNKVRVGA